MSQTLDQPPLSSDPLRRRIIADDDFHPWIRADRLDDCFLFWLPVGGFPITHDEKKWVTEFLTRLALSLNQHHNLRCEIFMQYKCVGGDIANDFMKYRRKSFALMGLGRRPGATITALPTSEQLQDIVKNNKSFEIEQWVGDYSFWFIAKQPERQRELFLGLGGMTTIFLPPDPKTKAPPLPCTPALRAAHPAFQKFDVDATHEATYAMSDAFLDKSKALFGAGLENEVQYEGLAFILPLLDSGHFFAAVPEQRAQWFDLFNVYVNESKTDRGIVLAFRESYDTLLLEVLESMRADGLTFPGNRQ
jgi:hypothetical protein